MVPPDGCGGLDADGGIHELLEMVPRVVGQDVNHDSGAEGIRGQDHAIQTTDDDGGAQIGDGALLGDNGVRAREDAIEIDTDVLVDVDVLFLQTMTRQERFDALKHLRQADILSGEPSLLR